MLVLMKNVTIIEPVNIYGCTIGKNSFIGPFVEIQKHSSIGESTKNPITFIYLRTR